jgi:hypothetical protein
MTKLQAGLVAAIRAFVIKTTGVQLPLRDLIFFSDEIVQIIDRDKKDETPWCQKFMETVPGVPVLCEPNLVMVKERVGYLGDVGKAMASLHKTSTLLTTARLRRSLDDAFVKFTNHPTNESWDAYEDAHKKWSASIGKGPIVEKVNERVESAHYSVDPDSYGGNNNSDDFNWSPEGQQKIDKPKDRIQKLETDTDNLFVARMIELGYEFVEVDGKRVWTKKEREKVPTWLDRLRWSADKNEG